MERVIVESSLKCLVLVKGAHVLATILVSKHSVALEMYKLK